MRKPKKKVNRNTAPARAVEFSSCHTQMHVHHSSNFFPLEPLYVLGSARQLRSSHCHHCHIAAASVMVCEPGQGKGKGMHVRGAGKGHVHQQGDVGGGGTK